MEDLFKGKKKKKIDFLFPKELGKLPAIIVGISQFPFANFASRWLGISPPAKTTPPEKKKQKKKNIYQNLMVLAGRLAGVTVVPSCFANLTYDITFSKWGLLTIAPMVVFGSDGSPTTNAFVA